MFCLLLTLLLVSELLYSNESTRPFFVCAVFQCIILSLDLAGLHIKAFPWRPLRDSFLHSNSRPYSIMLDLFFYQLLFYTYTVLFYLLLSRGYSTDPACSMCRDSCLQALRLYKTYSCAFTCHISSFICRNTF